MKTEIHIFAAEEFVKQYLKHHKFDKDSFKAERGVC